MRQISQLLRILVLSAVLAISAVAVAPAASAAEAECLTRTSVSHAGYHVSVPVYGNNVSCWLAWGSDNDGVKALQSNLNRCYGYNLVVDGAFGDNTYNALRTVQGQIGVSRDGEYGDNTRAALNWAHYNQATGSFHHCGQVW
jgi:peptidoglycan hydrolase-like protein with peptidoglycan-binding domain